MADRRPFEEKYAEIAKRWKISDEIVNYIIRRYTKKLAEELERLKVEDIKLPKFFRDRRTDEDYVYDLIDGWMMEDVVCDGWLRTRLLAIDDKIKITHMGTNRDRTLQKFNPRKITTQPDFIYEAALGKEIRIELQMARASRKEGYDMKESKVKRARKERNIFLWIIIPEDSFFIIDPDSDLDGVEPISNPLWGGKMVYRLGPAEIQEIGKYPLAGEIPKKFYRFLGLLEQNGK